MKSFAAGFAMMIGFTFTPGGASISIENGAAQMTGLQPVASLHIEQDVRKECEVIVMKPHRTDIPDRVYKTSATQLCWKN